jgi:hypothetical protein
MANNFDGRFVDGVDADSDSADFYATSQKGVLRSEQGGGGSSTGGQRAAQAPQDEIENHRDIAYTDPHVHEALETLTDWIVGDGFNVAPRNFEAAMESGLGAEAANVAQGGSAGDTGQADDGDAAGDGTAKIQALRRLMKQSEFWKVFNDWVRYALIDGHAFMELVVEDEQFRPKLLPTERMRRDLDKYGVVQGYELERPDGGGSGGGGGGGEDTISYEPHEVAELWFRKEPTDDFGRSFVEPVAEQADMLRDMEIDYARFIATKAYPPILWKLGDENNNWTEDQVQAWMDNVEQVEPDSMLAAPHDVDTEVVGTTSTSSSAGAMRLEETFNHLQNRVTTGLGVPALLMNMDPGASGQASATAMMPAYKRRVQRLQNIVKTAVEQQILKSLLTESAGLDSFTDNSLPEFQFGEHSSAEKRLEIDKLLKLFNNGLLTPEAFAERAGIEPQEVPEMWDGADLLSLLQELAGQGDAVQNPDGGSPTDTQGGAESAGGEVTSRQDPGSDSSTGRNRRSVTEDES